MQGKNLKLWPNNSNNKTSEKNLYLNILKISKLDKHGVSFFREFQVDEVRHPDDGLSLQVTGLNPDAWKMCRIGNGGTSPSTALDYFASLFWKKDQKKDGNRAFSLFFNKQSGRSYC